MMRRHRAIRQFDGFGFNFLDEARLIVIFFLGASWRSENVGIESRGAIHCAGFSIVHGLGFGI